MQQDKPQWLTSFPIKRNEIQYVPVTCEYEILFSYDKGKTWCSAMGKMKTKQPIGHAIAMVEEMLYFSKEPNEGLPDGMSSIWKGMLYVFGNAYEIHPNPNYWPILDFIENTNKECRS